MPNGEQALEQDQEGEDSTEESGDWQSQEDEDEEDDANQEVELEDYSTSEDDQEGNQGEGEGGGEERGSIGFDDDLDYSDEWNLGWCGFILDIWSWGLLVVLVVIF